MTGAEVFARLLVIAKMDLVEGDGRAWTRSITTAAIRNWRALLRLEAE